MRQRSMPRSITKNQVVARKPTGKEAALETAERLSPEELGVLVERLTTASNRLEAARIKECLSRGFYGF